MFRDDIDDPKQSYNSPSYEILTLYCNFTGLRFDHEVRWLKGTKSSQSAFFVKLYSFYASFQFIIDGADITTQLSQGEGIFENFSSPEKCGSNKECYEGQLSYNHRGMYSCIVSQKNDSIFIEPSQMKYPVSFEFAVRSNDKLSFAHEI